MAMGYASFRRPACDQSAAYDQKQLKRNERERKRNQGTKQAVLRADELRRLKEQGKMATVSEKLQEIERQEEEHRKQLQMVEESRRRFKAIDESRGEGRKLARVRPACSRIFWRRRSRFSAVPSWPARSRRRR